MSLQQLQVDRDHIVNGRRVGVERRHAIVDRHRPDADTGGQQQRLHDTGGPAVEHPGAAVDVHEQMLVMGRADLVRDHVVHLDAGYLVVFHTDRKILLEHPRVRDRLLAGGRDERQPVLVGLGIPAQILPVGRERPGDRVTHDVACSARWWQRPRARAASFRRRVAPVPGLSSAIGVRSCHGGARGYAPSSESGSLCSGSTPTRYTKAS